MDHRDLHHIMNNTSTQMFCPHCRAKISNKDFQLVNMHDEDCVFAVTCPQCSANLLLGAHLTKQPSWQELVSNASSVIQKKHSKQAISKEEVTQVTATLKNFNGSFNQLFSK